MTTAGRPVDAEAPFGRGLSPMLEDAYAPIFDEIVCTDARVIGEIPRDLNGVYLPNGPNPRHLPLGRYHWFDGDGMLHAAHFGDGWMTYRNRWIRGRTPSTPRPPPGARSTAASWRVIVIAPTGR